MGEWSQNERHGEDPAAPCKIPFAAQLLGCDKYLDRSMTIDFGTSGRVNTLTVEAHHVAGEVNGAEAKPGLLVKGTVQLRGRRREDANPG